MNRFDLYLRELEETQKLIAARNRNDKSLEHPHRPALKKLMELMQPDVRAINEPGKDDRGAVDFALMQNSYPIGYVEAKAIGEDLDKISKGEQLSRYYGYANLILTNHLEFRFYKHGKEYEKPIVIADAKFIPDQNSCSLLEATFKAFLKDAAEPVRKASHLAKIMGEHGKRIATNLLRFLKTDTDKNKPILEIYDAFKSELIHDLSFEAFADMYAQTLVYGLFVARYHDESQKDFSRMEALELIPQSNPLLRRFFVHIAGSDFDSRLKPIVDDLCKVFGNTDVKGLMQQIYKQDLWGTEQVSPDPVIHFYEDFLKEYDPKERKALGAYYTPPPVVQFIVRAVDVILKRDFALSEGLADTKKINHTFTVQSKKINREIHQVQVLDPAVGTGTFLNEIIRVIRRSFIGQEGRFASYVNEDLLPRLHGFEIMMAPYTIAHLKLSATLKESGASDLENRLGIYLTNSLEKGDDNDATLFGPGFGKTISEESRSASRIKNDTPIMVVIGNPPYSVSSSNPSFTVGTDGKKRKTWIGDLIDDYKRDLGERKINLDDDYIKFIRLAEHFIEKNGAGIVGMITNHSYINGVTHRQMRKHLLETFDEIYIMDLHGNSLGTERAPNGVDDQNVFEIQQGVSILLFVKKKETRKKKLATVYHAELWGRKEVKFKALSTLTINDKIWKKVEYSEPNYFFAPKDFSLDDKYRVGFKIDELFGDQNTGIQTKKDEVAIQFTREKMEEVQNDFLSMEEQMLHTKYQVTDGVWKMAAAIKDLREDCNAAITPILYRPFDLRFTILTRKSGGFLGRPRYSTMQHFVVGQNLGLVTLRLNGEGREYVSLVTNTIVEKGSLPRGNYSVFPLYLYEEDGSRHPNLNRDIVKQIASVLSKEPTPEEIFDYIYAVLHSPNYRERYKEFLKINFPRVPYPKDKRQFDALVALGKQLRELHLLESPMVRTPLTTYPEVGTSKVEKIMRKGDNVYINAAQYFGNVPEIAWAFYIGGYQPAQKWLKDRVGRTLTSIDIEHYQQIIVALVETDRLMKEIDKVVQF